NILGKIASTFQVNLRNLAKSREPFLKFYDKKDELENSSLDFKTKFLKQKDLQDLKRLEITVRNRKTMQAISRANGQPITIRSLFEFKTQRKKALEILYK